MTEDRHLRIGDRPHIVLVVPRGEAVRNFLYSSTLELLAADARVTLLTVVDDPESLRRFEPFLERSLRLEEFPQRPLVSRLRAVVEGAHDRWLWGATIQSSWAVRDLRAAEDGGLWRRRMFKLGARLLARRGTVEALTRVEQSLAHRLRPTRRFDELFARIEPDLVFNCSHIHGMAGELPLRVAKGMGIPTAGFIFSWDNLTSRSRIFVPYDDFLVWHEKMRRQLLDQYSYVSPEDVFVTGTPQFDFLFDDEFEISREELCARVGLDPDRPYVFYTAGIARHFPDEHRHVELVIRLLETLDLPVRPQLVVRTNVKDTSPAMRELAARGLPDVVFPRVDWDERWHTPLYEDLTNYTNLLRHAAMGINAASTVTLELLMVDKPVINLDFEPPGSDLDPRLGFRRHIRFDHYLPIAESGAVMVARSEADMAAMLERGLTRPEADSEVRRRFVSETFGDTLDGACGRRVAERLLALAGASGEA